MSSSDDAPRNPKGQFTAGYKRTPGTQSAVEAAASGFLGASIDWDGRMDSWSSQITGIGVEGYDKREGARFHGRHIDYRTLARMWECDDLIAKAIEAPGAEVFREGFEISLPREDIYEDLKEAIEDRLLELEVEDRLERAYQYKRCYGAGYVLLGINDQRPLSAPLNTKRKDLTIDYLEVYEPIELLPYEVYSDGAHNHNKVATYRLSGSSGMGSPNGASSGDKRAPRNDQNVVIHESRLIKFQGIQVSSYYQSSNLISPYIGASIVPRFYEQLRDLSMAFAGAGLLMTDMGQPIISVDGLLTKVGKNEGQLHDRMRALNLGRSVARAILLDAAKEKFERQSTNLTGIPDILDRLAQRGAGSVDIPLSVLIGYSPATLGSPDDSEITLWYNQTRKRQRREFTPPIRRIVDYIIPSLRKYKQPKRYGIHWHELEHMSTQDLVKARFMQQQSDITAVKAGMATPDELRKARWHNGYSFETMIDTSKEAPGFIAPLPAGLLPKGMTAEQAITSIEAGNAKPGTPASARQPAGAGAPAGGHTVAAHTRRDPKATVLGKSPRGTSGNAPKTKTDGDYTAANEALAQREAANRPGVSPAAKALLEQLAQIADAEAAACAAGTCGGDCCYDHPTMDEDQPLEHKIFAGLRIGIESPAGSTRAWTDTNGETGETTMLNDYGFVDGAMGVDGDFVDVYLGPDETSDTVYVIHQQSKVSDFAEYDEDKVMLGFSSADDAKAAYLAHYNDDRFFGSMSTMPMQAFLRRLVMQPGEAIS